MTLFALTATLVKFESVPSGYKLIRRTILGWRYTANENEAKGSFITTVQEENEEFAVDQLLCVEIPQRVEIGKPPASETGSP